MRLDSLAMLLIFTTGCSAPQGRTAKQEPPKPAPMIPYVTGAAIAAAQLSNPINAEIKYLHKRVRFASEFSSAWTMEHDRTIMTVASSSGDCLFFSLHLAIQKDAVGKLRDGDAIQIEGVITKISDDAPKSDIVTVFVQQATLLAPR